MIKASKLPSGYTQLWWIENTNKAYIILDFYATGDTYLETTIFKLPSYAPYLLGTRTSMNLGCYFALSHFHYYVHNTIELDYSAHGNTISASYGDFPISIKVDNGNFIANNNITPYTKETFASGSKFGLFCCCSGDGIVGSYIAECCIGYTKLSNNTDSVELIPCINPNNVVGMYDIINEKFYSSSNEGEVFIAGPAVF